MNINIFSQMVRQELEENYFLASEGFCINTSTVTQNNDTVLHAITIKNANSAAAPFFYLDDHLGEKPANAARNIALAYSNYLHNDSIGDQNDIARLKEFNNVKNRICYKIVNSEFNKENLRNKPNVPITGDLCAMFYIRLNENATISITDEIISNWGIKTEDAPKILLEHATHNTVLLKPAKLENLTELVFKFSEEYARRNPSEYSEQKINELRQNTENRTSEINEIYVLGTEDGVFGACALLYQNGRQLDHTLQEISKITGHNINSAYILPSSIHEILIVPENSAMSADYLQFMVRSVNNTCVSPKEILSNHIYHYDSLHGFKMIEIPDKDIDVNR